MQLFFTISRENKTTKPYENIASTVWQTMYRACGLCVGWWRRLERPNGGVRTNPLIFDWLRLGLVCDIGDARPVHVH